MQQLQATGAASASGSSGEQQQQQQVEALLRLASMSLPEFQQHLLAAGQAGDASTLAAGGAAEPAALAQQLLDGKVAAVMYELPFAEAGSPASTASYYECQRRLREAVDDPSAKAECLAELAEQLPAVKVLLQQNGGMLLEMRGGAAGWMQRGGASPRRCCEGRPAALKAEPLILQAHPVGNAAALSNLHSAKRACLTTRFCLSYCRRYRCQRATRLSS